ncbi:MAG: THUMP domain-containing protein [Thermoplasmata archaeon]|nr:THUMP domain-containing protein [Thermoplasmata archaeon]
MKHLIELSGESEGLAMAEAAAVGSLSGVECAMESDGRALVLDSQVLPSVFVSRLSLAWSVSRHMVSCSARELDVFLEDAELPGRTFRVRVSRLHKSHSPEDGRKLARHVGKILSERYSVDLKNPDTEVRILLSGKCHVGLLEGEIDRSPFEARKSENRPFKHPISLHPRLARALVNLTRASEGQTVLDPFCGTGGILLEAGLMGCHTLGGDIDGRMVDGTRLNMSHYGISDAEIRKTDVSSWAEQNPPVDSIATDPPYGRSASTAKEPIGSLYSRAFSACHSALKEGGRLAIVLPSETHVPLACGFTLDSMHPVRVHRSLTRYFCVFKKNQSK